MNMEDWWNDFDGGKLGYSEINLTQCHLAYHTSHRTSLGLNPERCGGRLSTDWPNDNAICSVGIGGFISRGKGPGL